MKARPQHQDLHALLFKVLANEDTLLLMMFLGLRKLGNICCMRTKKMFLNKISCCVRNICCARGQTGKHFCRQQFARNNVSSFVRAFTISVRVLLRPLLTITSKMLETGPTVYSPYPRRLERLTI